MSNPRHYIFLFIYLFIYFITGTCINHVLGLVLVLGLGLAEGWFPVPILILENIQNFEPAVQVPGKGNWSTLVTSSRWLVIGYNTSCEAVQITSSFLFTLVVMDIGRVISELEDSI
jgi:hypothetical protein